MRRLATPVDEAARAVLLAHQRPPGYTVPNAEVYPWQWLWDSAFHAIAWNALGEPHRAVSELDTVLRLATAEGFVAHVQYRGPNPHASFWAHPDRSIITQPPMFGHAIAELVRSGVRVPRTIVDRARAAMRFLLEHRNRLDGLVTVVHPWETGADDSPRWDHWCTGGFTPERWYVVKGDLVRTIVLDPSGSPVDNGSFASAPAGFNALVAYNASELAEVADDEELSVLAADLTDALDSRWDPHLKTWTDAGEAAGSSGRTRTLDGLLPALVTTRADVASAALGQILDPAAFGAPFGPLGVHRQEPTFEPGSYWRGGTWPQLAYLVHLAATRHGAHEVAAELGRRTALGARVSGFAEYWDGDTGRAAGAVPQSWTAIVAAMQRSATEQQGVCR